MEALLDFELTERSSIINNFEARNIKIILTTFRKTKMLENIRIFIARDGFIPEQISSIISKYCKDLNVKVIFFKLSNIFSPKDFIPDSLKSRVVCKFTCSGWWCSLHW